MSKGKRNGKGSAPAAPAPVAPSPRIALALAGVALVLGMIAATVQPWDPRDTTQVSRTPPDESAHLLYVRDLITEWRLPVLETGAGNYEAHQPPLYYLSCVPAALVSRAVSGGGTEKLLSTTEVMALRAWSVLIFAGVVVACYLIGTAVFPMSKWLPVATAGFAMLLPGHIINVAAVTNDGLAELFCCLTIWLAIRIVRDPASSWSRYATLGALIGGGLLTKTLCLFLLPVGVAAVLLGQWPQPGEPPRWGQRLSRAGVVVGVALGVWAPWIAHNLAHYPGDPLVAKTFLRIFGEDRLTPDIFLFTIGPLGYLRVLTAWTFASFWGVFGQAKVFMADAYYVVGGALALATCGGLVRCRREWNDLAAPEKRVWSVLALAAILVGLQFLQFNKAFFQAQARYLFPAIGPIACLFVVGLSRLSGAASGQWPKRLILGGIAVVAGMLLLALVECASGQPPRGEPLWVVDWAEIRRLAGVG